MTTAKFLAIAALSLGLASAASYASAANPWGPPPAEGVPAQPPGTTPQVMPGSALQLEFTVQPANFQTTTLEVDLIRNGREVAQGKGVGPGEIDLAPVPTNANYGLAVTYKLSTSTGQGGFLQGCNLVIPVGNTLGRVTILLTYSQGCQLVSS